MWRRLRIEGLVVRRSPIPVLLLQRTVKFGGLVVDTLTRATVCDQREWGRGRGCATQTFSEGAIHNVTHRLVPFCRAEFRLPKKIVVYDEGDAHTYDHIYAKWSSSRFPRKARPNSGGAALTKMCEAHLGPVGEFGDVGHQSGRCGVD
jgi:hypothetical protein